MPEKSAEMERRNIGPLRISHYSTYKIQRALARDDLTCSNVAESTGYKIELVWLTV